MKQEMKSNSGAAEQAERHYLTEYEVAERLGLSVQFLRRRRERREPPRYAKFGGSVRYPIREIEAFEAAAMQPLPPLREATRRNRR